MSDRDSLLYRLWRDVRYAWRRLSQSPGFTITAVLSLALGIGANTAIFSLVNSVLLRDQPYDAPEELVDIYIASPDFPHNVFSYPDFEDVRNGAGKVFSGVTAARLVLLQTDRNEGVEMLPGAVVTGNHFSLLGIEAHLGRTLLPEDDVAEGAHPVVVLGYGYWQRAFGADPQVVGRSIRLGGVTYDIVGVGPEDYPGVHRGIDAAVFAPTMMVNQLQPGDENELEARGNHSYFVKGRLRQGVTLPQAQATLDGIASHLRDQDLDNWDPAAGFLMIPTEDVIVFPPIDTFVRAASGLLIVTVGLVLLLACTNLASFLLARGVDRRKEIALRLAMGAPRSKLISQLLTETVVLGLLGGVAGIVVSVALLRLLVNADLPLPVPINLDLGLDATVLTFTFVVSLLAGGILGLAPALQSTNPNVATTLREDLPGSGQRTRVRLRSALVIAQVAGSLVLLVGAGLFLRSFQHIQTVDPGFGHEPTAILALLVPSTRYSEEEGRVFTRTLLDRFSELPGVETVGLIENLHLNTLSTRTNGINVDGVEPPPERQAHSVDTSVVNPSFFSAAGIQILQGRNFSDSDLPGAPAVAIINQTMAERFWPGENALGRTLRRDSSGDLTVVGVASDAKIRSLGEPPRPFIYRPYRQEYAPFYFVLARTSLDPAKTALDMLAAGRELDPSLWAWQAKTMEDHLGIQLLPRRLSVVVLTAFAAVALMLASIGLYGIVSYAVSRRAREVGVRMSLGADRASVVWLLMGSGMKLVAAGTVVGLVIAVVAVRLLGGLLITVSTLDLATFLATPAILVAAASLASYIPARRASKVDPAVALRTE